MVIGVGQENGWASLSVADAGPGLTDEERDHVFERFWRADRVAGILWAPYLAWVSFATALNAAIWWLNR